MPDVSPKTTVNPIKKTVQQMTEEVASTQQSINKNFSPDKVLFQWRSISRPFKKRSREYWITTVSIASLLAFILFLAEGVMPVVLIGSLVFLYFILSTVRPEEVDYQITERGVKIASVTTTWDMMTSFWFTKKLDSDILVLETITFPNRLELVITPTDIPVIRKVLAKYVEELEPEATYLDKATDWFSRKLPNS